MPATQIAVFISGSGSNLQALIDAIARGELACRIALVVSNRKAAYGLIRAANAGIPTLYFPLKPYTDAGRPRTDYDADLAAQIAPYRLDLIVLAGWMHILSPAFLESATAPVINLHPALPGQFPGANAIEAQFAAFQRGELAQAGCMVHQTIPALDAGPVIGQAVVPLQAGDTLEAFTARMHAAEHRLLVECVRKMLEA